MQAYWFLPEASLSLYLSQACGLLPEGPALAVSSIASDCKKAKGKQIHAITIVKNGFKQTTNETERTEQNDVKSKQSKTFPCIRRVYIRVGQASF